jgi:DNA polymerase III delta prime subunit
MVKMKTPEHLQELRDKLCQAAHDGSLNQSVLFIGREGIGKISLIMNLAQTLLCENDRTACGHCSSCTEVARLYHPDFLYLFPFPNLRPESKKMTIFPFSDPVGSSAKFSEETHDAVEEHKQAILEDPFSLTSFEKKVNIPVEVIKDLMQSLAKRPMLGGRRVVAILDIDKMAYGAADLFLKTVEEPPKNTHLLLTTSRPDLLYPTLLSRTQRIKVPPVPEDNMVGLLKERLKADDNICRYLARISGGSPGIAGRLHEADVTIRRDRLLELILMLLKRENMGQVIIEVNSQYSGGKTRYDDTEIDFDILETIIHDLYLAGENRLDNHLINVDIKPKFREIKAPRREVLDIWNECCAEVRRSCTVNNVAADAGMMFFFISCAEAMESQTRPKYTLP